MRDYRELEKSFDEKSENISKSKQPALAISRSGINIFWKTK